MAQQFIEEPWVRVRERIRQTPNLLNITGTSNIGGVIVAPTGPALSYVTGPEDFLKKYTVDGSIPRNAHISFINAYYLSFSTGLVLARAMNTKATAGLIFKYISKVQYPTFVELQDDNIWLAVIGGTVYFYNGGNTDAAEMVDYVTTSDELNPSEALVTLLKNSSTPMVAVSDLYDLADKLSAVPTSASDNTPKYGKVIYSSYNSALISESSALSSSVITQTLNFEFNYISSTTLAGFETENMLFKDGVPMTESQILTVPVSTLSNWAFTYGTMAYYHGAVDISLFADYSLKKINSLDDLLTSINGINGMCASEEDDSTDTNWKIKIQFSKGNELAISSDANLMIGFSGNSVPSLGTVTSKNSLLSAGTTAFWMYAHTSQDHNAYVVNIYPDADNLFQININDGLTSETYTVSLDSEALDQSGSNAFIENLNALGLDFTFVTNNNYEHITDAPKCNQAFSFGDSGLDLSASSGVQCLITGVNALADQELYDIEYLAPFGLVDLQYIKNYCRVGKLNDWFTPVDAPYDKTNANSIIGYMINISDDSNIICMGPFDKNTGLTGWMNYIACSTLYYTKILNNKAIRSEFAPCFEETNGPLDFTNPVYMLGADERSKLLNAKAPINFLVYNIRQKSFYLNNNLTHQAVNNIVSEEQNRRIVNKIKKDCKRLMQRFKGQINNSSTRSSVETLIRYYFSTQIMNQEYKPVEYEVQCNDDNNPIEIINANKLAVAVRVRLSYSTKYIDVLVDVFPLGVNFNE